MINLYNHLKAEFDKRQQEREQNFTAAAERARRMLADFPVDALPCVATVTSECDIWVEWAGASPGVVMCGTFSDEKTSLSSCLRGYPDPKDPQTGAELLAEIQAAQAYQEPCETCTRCGQTVPARGEE